MSTRCLLIGYGNPGRLDDCLGPALADHIAAAKFPHVTVESNYHLTVEDAYTVAGHDVSVFADASVNGEAPFFFREITPALDMGFSTHGMTPEGVLGLAWRLFDAKTRGYVLGVRGYYFDDFGETLSARAAANLQQAIMFMTDTLQAWGE